MRPNPRQPSTPIEDGPFTYELIQFRLDDLLAAGAAAQVSKTKPESQALALMQVTVQLRNRMLDPRQPAMLCMTCDHEFSRDEAPAEIFAALPWANAKHPPLASPICAKCAAADLATKADRMKTVWAKLSPGARTVEPGLA